MADDLIERLRSPDVWHHRGPNYEPVTIPPSAIRLEAAEALASTQAEILRLKAALEPFAKAAGCHSDVKSFMPDEMLIWRGGECAIRLGDLRAARSLSLDGEEGA